MGKDKFVEGNARKKVPRPQPPHGDRRLKRNKTRSDQERAAEREFDEDTVDFLVDVYTLTILPCEICGRSDGRHTEEECFK